MNWKKYCTKENMIVLILSGILLLVISVPTGQNKRRSQSFIGASGQQEDMQIQNTVLEQEEMETKVRQILQEMAGVGKVRCMITWEKVSDGSDSRWMIMDNRQQEAETKAMGVLVVCEGGGNGAVKNEITEAMMCLFHLEANRIKVVKMRSEA